MCEGKTIVPILCMHRSGSSLATNVLFELGMSLGPFTMLKAAADNPHGFFESYEFCELNDAVQEQVIGFPGDMPRSAETLQRFVESEGRWPDGSDVPPSWLDQGEDLIRRLAASGAVSGFKDPRVPLVWPFWMEVFGRICGLRVVPLVLLRSPHEIAMSIFMRSQGRYDYGDALDVTAAHYKRIAAIAADWPGPLARVRFLPDYFVADLRAASGLLGLAWDEEVCGRVFDAGCKHHEAAAVAHPAQALFEQLAAIPAQEFTRENAARIEKDAAVRQRLLRRNQVSAEAALAPTQAALAPTQAALAAAQGELAAVKAELAAVRTELTVAAVEASRLADDLRTIKASRFWQLRESLVAIPGLKQLANRPLPPAKEQHDKG